MACDMETIAQIIKDMRDLGMTQAEIGEALGLSQAYISGIESGKRGGRTPADTLDRARAVWRELCSVEGRRSTDKKSSP